MKKETVKTIVKGVGAFGTGAYCAVPAAIYSAAIKGWWPLKLSVYVAAWGLSMGLFDEYVEPALDELVDHLMDDDPAETVTE